MPKCPNFGMKQLTSRGPNDNDRPENEHKAISAIKKNIKYFYSYAKKFNTLKSCIGPLVDSTDSTCSYMHEENG